MARPSAYRRRWLFSFSSRLGSRVIAPICRFSPTCMRIWVRVLLRDRLDATFLPLDWRRGCRIDKSSIQRRFWCRDVEAPLALGSPIKVPDCGGFSSSVIPAKLPERGGSYSSIVAGFWSPGSILGFSFFLLLVRSLVKLSWFGFVG